ncbi:hypothetical protein [Bradyrhizobium liaoningense]|uniref:hypothetical protein n=1 Tax=Bradyrhizobium liaoningense TaxID=43992 RepID=UPI001BACB3EC|nr:hypothetical protein [Bradyrhizobium liaoningense]MBR1033050.1 hypothetical protein [Bradyrhizobium liaoningense]
MSRRLPSDYYFYLALLKSSPFVRRPRGWRFGTRRIGDSVVDRLVAAGRAQIIGDRVHLVEAER